MTIGVDRAKRDKQVRELDRHLNCILIGDVLLYIQCGNEEEVEEGERREKERGKMEEEGRKRGATKHRIVHHSSHHGRLVPVW